MNRYARLPGTGPSKASAQTLCQKCLKRDNYECKAVAQERPYVARPSRTQQLLNPKLVPKLNSDLPQDLLRKKGVADEQLAIAEQERGRKRERQIEEAEPQRNPKRVRSSSVSSVSTISTNLSRSLSRSLTPERTRDVRSRNRSNTSRSPQPQGPPHQESTYSVSPRSRKLSNPEKKRRRTSVSSEDSYTSDERSRERSSRERFASRSTRRKFQQHSPRERGRNSESRSPFRDRDRFSNDRRQRGSDEIHGEGRNTAALGVSSEHRPTPRERSLSPFSKRLALTQAMNMGG